MTRLDDTETATGVVRKPVLDDIDGICALLDAAARLNTILPRRRFEICEGLRDFHVYVDADGVSGCCALHIDTPDLAEVRSLVVRESLRGQGIGARVVEACLDEARSLRIARVYALTRARRFFARLGFQEIDKFELPHKIFNDCARCHLFPDCDETAMIRRLIPVSNAAEAVEDPLR